MSQRVLSLFVENEMSQNEDYLRSWVYLHPVSNIFVCSMFLKSSE